MKLKTFWTALLLWAAPFAAFAQSGDTNMIVNPWMEIDQVNEGASTTLTASAAGTYTNRKQGDGWYGMAATSASSLTTAFQNAAVAPNGSVSDLLVTVGTGSATHADGTLLAIHQYIEPIRMSVLQMGTANAQAFYIQFCAKASIGGTYSVAVLGGASATLAAIHTVGSSWMHQYNLTAAKWGCFKFKVPGDTGGTWLSTSSTNTVDTTHGMSVAWILGMNGVTTDKYGVSCVDGVWQNGGQNCIGDNTTNVAMDKTSSSTFELTGVKISIDDAPLIHQPSEELFRAQRYYAKSFTAGYAGNSGTKPAQGSGVLLGVAQASAAVAAAVSGIQVQFPNVMRAAPTVTAFDPKNAAADSNCFDIVGTSTTGASTVDPGVTVSQRQVYIKCAASIVGTAGNPVAVHWTADARM